MIWMSFDSVSADLTMRYDALNRLTNLVSAGTFTNGYAYDRVGKLLSEDGPWADDTLSYTYTHRLRTAMTLNAQPAVNLSYAGTLSVV